MSTKFTYKTPIWIKLCSLLALLPGILLLRLAISFLGIGDFEITVVEDNCVHEENEGKFVMLSGTIEGQGLAVDEDYGVKVNSPCLWRTTKMYQYLKNGSDEIYWGWEANRTGSVTDKYGDRYSNPSYPSGISGGDQYFYSDFYMGGGDMPIDGEFAEKLSYSSYIHFEDHYYHAFEFITDLPDTNKLPSDFVNLGSSYMSNDGYEDIGTVKISYRYLDPALLEGHEFTIVGKQENGRLIDAHGDTSMFVDSKMNLEQIKEAYGSFSSSAFWGCMVFAIIALIIGIVVVIINFKNK